MPQTNFEQVFLEAASEVLETMFFTGVEAGDASEDGEILSAELTFTGHISGRFGVRVSERSGKLIAANFLGTDEATRAQAAEVLCELANMLCGSVLSRIESEARFELRHPELDQTNRDWRTEQQAVGYTFGTEEGTLTMWISFADPAQIAPAA